MQSDHIRPDRILVRVRLEPLRYLYHPIYLLSKTFLHLTSRAARDLLAAVSQPYFVSSLKRDNQFWGTIRSI